MKRPFLVSTQFHDIGHAQVTNSFIQYYFKPILIAATKLIRFLYSFL